MSTSQVLQRLYSLDKSSSEFIRALYTFLRLDENGEYSLSLQQSESARLVDFLDGALDVIPVTDALFRRCHRRLRQICGHHNILPSSHIISTGLKTTSEHAIAFGGFADVWEGILGSEKVCVKVLRIYNGQINSQKRVLAPLYGEAVVWKRLRHPNVVPFLGVATVSLQLVSRWMPNGTLTDYVGTQPHVDRIGLLLDVAEGLNYLHTCHTVHGDLKGPNILIDGTGNARVCDFGLASIAQGKYSTGPKSDKGHTARWSAPEILFGECITSKQADIFAFGMVVVEAFTGKVPFHNFVSSTVTWKLMNGDRPSRPYEAREFGLTDSVWKMTECCWVQPPKDRLKVSEVVDLLREMYAVPSNNNPVNTASGTAKPDGTGPTIPQTEAALSPRLLEILRYRESTRERTPSNATVLSNDRRTAAGALLERPKSTPAHQTPGQHLTGGIMERFGQVDQVRQGPPPPLPDSITASTTGSESWHQTEATLHDRTNPGDHGPKSVDGTWGPPQPSLSVPRIFVQKDPSSPSNRSSFTIIDGPENQRPIPADLETSRRAGDTNNREVGDARNGHGFSGSRNNRGDGDIRGSNDAKKRGSQQPGQQPGRPLRLAPVPNLSPPGIEPTMSRTSSLGKKAGGLLAKLLGGGSSRPSTRPTTPTSELGGESRPADAPPQQPTAPKKLGGWRRVRVVTKVLGLSQGQHSQPNDTGE